MALIYMEFGFKVANFANMIYEIFLNCYTLGSKMYFFFIIHEIVPVCVYHI
jgi:hypothetical protein